MTSAGVALPASLRAHPRLSQWLQFNADETVTVRTGKVEFGQGIRTALAQLVAAELELPLACIRMQPADTRSSPDEGVTAGSLSVQESGAALRQVCAEARALLLAEAARQLQAAPAELLVAQGCIRRRGADGQTSYWALAQSGVLEREATGFVAPAPPSPDGLLGRPVAQLDLPAKIRGQAHFIHDLELPGMLYGRVARPPSPGAQLRHADLGAVRALPGVVSVVCDGRFLGVVAEQEYTAVQALKRLQAAASWHEAATLPDAADLPSWLQSQPVETSVYAEQQAPAPLPPTQQRFRASYARPFLAHASIGPSCGVARFSGGRLEVWTHSQGIFNLRADLARMLDLPPTDIDVFHVEGAGCYGHNGADDAACDAVLLARALPGRAVQVVWSREDELSWSPLGAAMAVTLEADVAADGRITQWRHEIWSNGHSSRPGRAPVPVLLGATHRAQAAAMPPAANMPRQAGGGAERNAMPVYDFAQWQVVNHRLLAMPLRTSSLRSLGAHCNVFASESFLDEIAIARGEDPLAYRLRHLEDVRLREVLQTAAAMAGWSGRPQSEAAGRGMGLGVSRYKNTGAYCAAVALVEAGHELRVHQLWIAVDVGLVVNPDGVRNQIEGGAIQTVSWMLKEAVQFDRTRITSASWEQYPILRFSEVPRIEIQLLDRPHEKSLGAGEATQGPVAAAIGNALAAALGVRVRQMPFTTEALTRAVLAEP
jgi:CO/xanthine dehydrogenase Mo-binding subunit